MSDATYPPDPPLDARTKKWHLMWDTLQGIQIMTKRLSDQLDELANDETEPPNV